MKNVDVILPDRSGQIKIPSKEKDFSGWYNALLTVAGIVDEYSVKGTFIYLPYGWKIFRNIMNALEKLLDEHDHLPVKFPVFIRYEDFAKESEHIRGFENEVFWVRGGLKGAEKMVMRPTSEVPFYTAFARWIKTEAQLPIKLYQTVDVYRYETKNTVALIRVREIPWNEAHTAHATEKEALEHMEEVWKIYNTLISDYLAVWGIRLWRPEWDKFPGAVFTQVIDAIFPNGRALQIAGNHYLGQKFSRVYDIRFIKKDGTQEYAYQTCYGVSIRLVASVLAIHGDDTGFILPYPVAPIQVVVLPIRKDKELVEYCAGIAQKLKENGIRVELDDRDWRLGEKMYYWAKKGVPFVLRVGPREMKSNAVEFYIRHLDENPETREKRIIPVEEIYEQISAEGKKQVEWLRQKHKSFTESLIVDADNHDIKSLEDMKKIVERFVKEKEKTPVFRIPFCSMDMDGKECAEKIKAELQMEVRGYSPDEPSPENKKCLICGRPAKYMAYVMKVY